MVWDVTVVKKFMRNSHGAAAGGEGGGDNKLQLESELEEGFGPREEGV